VGVLEVRVWQTKTQTMAGDGVTEERGALEQTRERVGAEERLAVDEDGCCGEWALQTAQEGQPERSLHR